MGRKKNDKGLKVSNTSMEDFIWMSYRYCIGRHTISAVHHAETIHSVVRSNPDMLSDTRRAFNVIDIRREITSQIAFRSNVYIDGCGDFDAFTLLLIEGSKYKDRDNVKFILNSYTNELSVEESDSKYEAFDKDYIDLIPWVRLANYLDKKCHKKITVHFNDEDKEFICYQYPMRQGDGSYKMVWSELDSDVTMNRWLDEEYIVKVEDLI